MNIPFSQYQLAHVRKAVFAGLGMLGTAVLTAVINGASISTLETWPAGAAFLGAFAVGFLGTFNIPNKDFMLVEKVIEAINPVLGEKVAVILDPAMAAREPTDQPTAVQTGPVPLVVPPDPPATPITTPAPAAVAPAPAPAAPVPDPTAGSTD